MFTIEIEDEREAPCKPSTLEMFSKISKGCIIYPLIDDLSIGRIKVGVVGQNL